MDNTLLFDGEEIISSSDDKVITLTTRRLRYNDSSFGKAHVVSMHLENISSIEIHYRSWTLILLAGVLLIVFGFFMGSQNQGDSFTFAMVSGVVCILVYLFTRKHMVTISSNGGAKINFQTQGMKRDTLLLFINRIEKAKSLIKL